MRPILCHQGLTVRTRPEKALLELCVTAKHAGRKRPFTSTYAITRHSVDQRSSLAVHLRTREVK
jgi:hypothetical protein